MSDTARVDLRLEEFNGKKMVLAVFEDEHYWRSNEREIYTSEYRFGQLDRSWYKKHTRPATYSEAKRLIEALEMMYDDIQFCTIDWQAHSKRERKEAKRGGKS